MSVASVDKPLDAWSLLGDDDEDCLGWECHWVFLPVPQLDEFGNCAS